MNENYIMLNGKRVDLTDEQIEKLGLKTEEKKDCFKYNYLSGYYYINSQGRVNGGEFFDHADTKNKELRYEIANYCTDKSLLQQRAYHETLSRLLWRFSMQNDGDKIDWSYYGKAKYSICYDTNGGKFCIRYCYHVKYFEPYFYSEEIAQRAIDEIVLPFMKEHPDFVW